MRHALNLLLASVLALIVACTAASTSSPGYELHEFAVDGPSNLKAGSNSVLVDNTGEFPHTLVVARSDGTVVAATDLIQAGDSVQLDLDLEPGVYQFTCRIVSQRSDGQIVDHFQEGMSRAVSVGQ